MQGKKQLQPKMLYTITLEQLVPPDNFYRRLNKVLPMHWLYIATENYYGAEGQESIDPVVFFKICLVGYINNINSDRKLIEYGSDSLEIRLFLGYDVDEPLAWHSDCKNCPLRKSCITDKQKQKRYSTVFTKQNWKEPKQDDKR